MSKSGDVAIDLLPVLTETGGGAQMAFFDGISVETTEKLAGKWCGDLLQYVKVELEGDRRKFTTDRKAHS